MRLRDLALSTLLVAGCAGARTTSSISPAVPSRVVLAPVADTPIDRAQVRARLADRRKLVIERFLAYREGRVYPINALPGGGFRHVWLDDQGNLCAAATLVSLDLGRDAAIRAAAGNTEIKMADARTGALNDWILTSGLTRHEIVAIQVPGWQARQPRPPIERPAPVDPQIAARAAEVQRLYQIYQDVERQLSVLATDSLDEATDALMKRPDLARALLADHPAPVAFAKPPVRA